MGHPMYPGKGGAALVTGTLLVFQGRVQSLEISCPLEGNNSPLRDDHHALGQVTSALRGEEKLNEATLPGRLEVKQLPR